MTDDGAELSRLALDGSSPCEDVDADLMSLGFGEVGLKEKQIKHSKNPLKRTTSFKNLYSKISIL